MTRAGQPGSPSSLGPVLGGTGTSGYLALSALPSPSTATASTPVPAPLVAPPVAAPGGSGVDPQSPLEVLLPPAVDGPAEAGGGSPRCCPRRSS